MTLFKNNPPLGYQNSAIRQLITKIYRKNDLTQFFTICALQGFYGRSAASVLGHKFYETHLCSSFR